MKPRTEEQLVSWNKRILIAIIKEPAVLVITGGKISNRAAYHERTGYRRFFNIQWSEQFGRKDIQNHGLPVSAWNGPAREVRGEGPNYIGGYMNGEIVDIIAKFKNHDGYEYLELLHIQRSDDVRD